MVFDATWTALVLFATREESVGNETNVRRVTPFPCRNKLKHDPEPFSSHNSRKKHGANFKSRW